MHHPRHVRLASAITSLSLLMAVSCTDSPPDTGQNSAANNGTSMDMGGGGGDMTSNSSAGLGLGAACSTSASCASGVCVKGSCATAGGSVCGPVHCGAGDRCEAGSCTSGSACAAEMVCGEACCLANEECVEGACLPSCQSGGPGCQTDEGYICCGAGQVCLFGGCIDPGNACNESMPCPNNRQFCEPTLGLCIERDADPNACVYIPPTEAFSPVEAWSWTSSTNSPGYDQVMMMPVVGNLTDDDLDGNIDEGDIPDVVFVTFTGNAYNAPGVLRVISGDGRIEHWSSADLPAPFFVRGGTIPSIADIDEDGIMEILVGASDVDLGLYAIEHDGAIKWHQPAIGSMGHGSPSVVNLDGAGGVEIVTSNAVLASDGQIICNLSDAHILPMTADLDGDGVQEILLGANVWQVDNIDARDGSGCSKRHDGPAGAGAIADLDADGQPEVVVVDNGDIVMFEHDSTEVWRKTLPLNDARIQELYGIADCGVAPAGQACATHDACGGGDARCYGGTCYPHKACHPGGGPPTIADFDGDGAADIAIAARWYYVVMRADGEVIWAHSTFDFSSGVTGSAVFDFEGDGKAEVVYNDEQFLRVYRGSGAGEDLDGDGFDDPVILLEEPNTSGTLYEYPLVVDVDNDGNAEIVVAANDYSSGTNPDKTKGIRVFRDASNNWVQTRPIWNQHTYHVTNIEVDGTVPTREMSNWTTPYLNNYRQNVQGGSLFNAPDLTVEVLDVDGSQCTTSVVITVELRNEGSLGVRAGAVDFIVEAVTSSGNVLLAEGTNTAPLAPGGSQQVEITWELTEDQLGEFAGKELSVRATIDRDAQGGSRHNECDEENNSADGFALCELAM